MSEMTPTRLARRRRTVLLALAISAILSLTIPLALADDLHHDDQHSDPDFFAENANNDDFGDPDDVSPFDQDTRPAKDQRAALLCWGRSHRRHRVRQCCADYSLHAWMAHRARSLVLSSEAMAAIGVWRGPRGPPPKIRGGKKFLGYNFFLHRAEPSTLCQLSAAGRDRQQNFGRSDGE